MLIGQCVHQWLVDVLTACHSTISLRHVPMTRCHGSSCDLIYDIDRFAQMKQQLDRQLQEIAFQEDPQLLFDRSFPGSTRSTFFSSGRSSPQVQVYHKRTWLEVFCTLIVKPNTCIFSLSWHTPINMYIYIHTTVRLRLQRPLFYTTVVFDAVFDVRRFGIRRFEPYYWFLCKYLIIHKIYEPTNL